MSTSRFCLLAGSLLMAAAVAAGAVGSHAVRDRFAPEELARYEIAVKYGVYHALGLVLLGLATQSGSNRFHRLAAGSFLFGIAGFSCALVATLVLDQRTWVHRFPPYGGAAFILGWLLFACAAGRGTAKSGGQ